MPEIARPLLMMAVIGTFTFEFEVSLPLLARMTYHVGRTGVPWLSRIAFLYAVTMGLLAAAPTLATGVAACVLVGAATLTFLTTGNSTIQLASQPDYRGRVTALWSTALVGSTPVGSPIIGAISDAAGPGTPWPWAPRRASARCSSGAGPPIGVTRRRVAPSTPAAGAARIPGDRSGGQVRPGLLRHHVGGVPGGPVLVRAGSVEQVRPPGALLVLGVGGLGPH